MEGHDDTVDNHSPEHFGRGLQVSTPGRSPSIGSTGGPSLPLPRRLPGAIADGRIQPDSAVNMSSTLIGFAMWSFIPAASALSRSPTIALAVIAMTGR